MAHLEQCTLVWGPVACKICVCVCEAVVVLVPSRDNYRLRILPSTCKDKKALGGGGRPVIKTSAVFSSGKERGPRSPAPPPPRVFSPLRIKTRICYNLNNCAADEFKILQSYLLVGHKALLIIILEDFRFCRATQSA